MLRLSSLVAVGFIVSGCGRELLVLREDSVSRAPIVESISPTFGLVGQTVVHVRGRNFGDEPRVLFGGEEAIWAVGDQYTFSDTELFVIAPPGAPRDAEVSVVSSQGSGAAPDLFRSFDSEPAIEELSQERLTSRTQLIIRGVSFNPDDVAAKVLIGATEIIDPQIETDRIVVDLRLAQGFSSIGHGWRILRYTYTPYFEGGSSEAAVPVYVVQLPEIASIDGVAPSEDGPDIGVPVFAGAETELEVKHYDDFNDGVASFADNTILVGGVAASIVSVRPSKSTDTRLVGVRFPDLARVYPHPVVVVNAAGASDDDRTVVITGRGHPRPGAQAAGCAPLALEFSPETYQRSPEASGRFAHALGYNDTRDAVVTYDVAGSANGIWTAAMIRDAMPTMKVLRAAHLGEVGYTVAVAADDTFSATRYQLVVVGLDEARAFDLPLLASSGNPPPQVGITGPAYETPAASDPRTLAIWVPDAGDVHVVNLPPIELLQSGGAEVLTVAMSPLTTLSEVRMWRSFGAWSSVVAIGVDNLGSSRVVARRFPDAPPRTVTTLRSEVLDQPRAMDLDQSSAFILTREGGVEQTWSIDLDGGSISKMDLGFAIPSSNLYDARVVSGRWWALDGYTLWGFNAYVPGGSPVTELVIPGSYNSVLLNSRYTVSGLAMQPGGGVVVSGVTSGTEGQESVRYVASAPSQVSFSILGQSTYDYGATSDVYTDLGIIRASHMLGRVTQEPYRMVAHEVVSSREMTVGRALVSNGDPNVGTPRPRGLVWAKHSDHSYAPRAAEEIVFSSATDLPLRIAAFARTTDTCPYAREGFVVVTYGVQDIGGGALMQTVRVHEIMAGDGRDGLWRACELANVPQAVPDDLVSGFSLEEVLSGGLDLEVAITSRPFDPTDRNSCDSVLDLVLAAASPVFSGVFTTSARSSSGSPMCRPSSGVMGSAYAAVAIDERPTQVYGVGVDPRGDYAAVSGTINGDNVLHLLDLTRTPALLTVAPDNGGNERAYDMVATPTLLVWTSGDTVIGAAVELSSSGVELTHRYRAPFDRQCTTGGCVRLALSPDREQVWLMRRAEYGIRGVYDRLLQIEASSGAPLGEVDLSSAPALHVGFSPDGEEVRVLSTTSRSNLSGAYFTSAGADVCAVR